MDVKQARKKKALEVDAKRREQRSEDRKSIVRALWLLGGACAAGVVLGMFLFVSAFTLVHKHLEVAPCDCEAVNKYLHVVEQEPEVVPDCVFEGEVCNAESGSDCTFEGEIESWQDCTPGVAASAIPNIIKLLLGDATAELAKGSALK